MARLSGSFTVGALTIHHVSDGAEQARRDSWFNGIDPSVWAPAVGVDGADALFPVNYGAFVITGDGRVTLVDTGFGSPARGRAGLQGGGELLERLAEIGVDRGDVDLVVQTHLHSDHCGWLVHDDGATLSFPNATVYVHEKELAYWTTGASDGNPMSPFVRSRVVPVRAAGRLSTFDRSFAVSPAVTAVPTPGHTPGHSSVLVVSNGAHALLLGDVAHHPIHLEHHDWLPRIDLDPPESIRSRQKMAALAVERDALVTAPHMPIVTLGRVRRAGAGYRYVPERVPSDDQESATVEPPD
jgi:glyoxylase-like metal-dependent hydrolase (beta-lactamase superfamily II)